MPLQIVIGTTAELIKVAPIIRRMQSSDYELICTKQQGKSLDDLIDNLGFSRQTRFLHSNRDPLVRLSSVPFWVLRTLIFISKAIRKPQLETSRTRRGLVVHGDTMTALLAALVGRAKRVDVIHVEAGLRSGTWRNPFPEEICRRAIGNLATLHFAPTLESASNLRKAPGSVIFTHGNTSRDALFDQLEKTQNLLSKKVKYGLVTLHRSELLQNEQILASSLKEIIEVSKVIQIRIVLDERTESVIKGHSLWSILEVGCVKTYKKLAHREFVEQLINAEFVITDSGGIQEECAILGIPCLIHRRFTERRDGLGISSEISQWIPGAIVDFGEKYVRYRHDSEQNGISPSQIIWRELVERGYVSD